MDSMYERIGREADTYQQLLFIMNGGCTRRFHTVHTIKDDLVAAHSQRVGLLCWLLLDGLPSVNLLMAALTHDLAEQVWGDVPSPIKRLMNMDTVTNDPEDKMLKDNALLFNIDETERRVLKLADKMDCLLFCVLERQLGNLNMELVFPRELERINLLLEQHNSWSITEVLDGIKLLWEGACGNGIGSKAVHGGA